MAWVSPSRQQNLPEPTTQHAFDLSGCGGMGWWGGKGLHDKVSRAKYPGPAGSSRANMCVFSPRQAPEKRVRKIIIMK